MTKVINDLCQEIGFPITDWQPREHPRGARMQGKLCRLEPVDIDLHAADLFDAFRQNEDHRNWTYLPYGPFFSEQELRQWVASTCLGDDPCFSALLVITRKNSD